MTTSPGQHLTKTSGGPTALEGLRQLHTLRRDRGEEPAALSLRQDEMYHLAQVVMEYYEPGLQGKLTQARRQVMHLLNEHKATLMGAVITPTRKKANNERWFDHQITPEVTRDPGMTGLIVPRDLARRVVQLHRLQISAITDLLIRGR